MINMNPKTAKIGAVRIAPLLLAVAVVLVFAPKAQANIVVDGNRQFTDDVNECINKYRNAPGIVGDSIKQLENSKNVHKIINSPDWSNTPNSDDVLSKGDGTVTRVDKNELEVYKKKFPELKDKDFCTALLHELRHAVDGDQGTWSANGDELNGINKNEIKATIFQNLIHAIRGVPPRTSYGGVDISEYIFTPEERAHETKAVNPPVEMIKVIPFRGKYIPVSELQVMTHSGCEDQPHWHSVPEVGYPVKATDGTMVTDPGPECGFGRVSDVPVKEVPKQ